jgi:hypothetical protein
MSVSPPSEPPAGPAIKRVSPLRAAALLAAGALVVLAAADLAASRTAYWFFQPWIGPLARQNVKLFCTLRSGDAGEVVLLGDSRVRHDLVAGAMEDELSAVRPTRVMNLGLDAAQLIALREIAGRVRALPHPPRVVVIGVAAYTLNDHNPRLGRDLRLYAGPAMMARGLVRCPDLTQKLGAIAGLTRGLEVGYQLPGLGEARGQCRLAELTRGSAYLPPGIAGAEDHNRQAVPYRSETARRRAYEREVSRIREEGLKHFTAGPLSERLFRELIATVRAGNAEPLVVLMPESAEFHSATAVAGRDEGQARLQALCAELGVRFVDLNDDPYRPASADYFDYADHLLPDPAVRLSRLLAQRELAPILGRSP